MENTGFACINCRDYQDEPKEKSLGFDPQCTVVQACFVCDKCRETMPPGVLSILTDQLSKHGCRCMNLMAACVSPGMDDKKEEQQQPSDKKPQSKDKFKAQLQSSIYLLKLVLKMMEETELLAINEGIGAFK